MDQRTIYNPKDGDLKDSDLKDSDPKDVEPKDSNPKDGRLAGRYGTAPHHTYTALVINNEDCLWIWQF